MILYADFKIKVITSEQVQKEKHFAYIDSITFNTQSGKIRIETNDETQGSCELTNTGVNIYQKSKGLLITNLETGEETEANDINLLSFLNDTNTVVEECFVSEISDDFDAEILSVDKIAFLVDDVWKDVPSSVINKFNESISH